MKVNISLASFREEDDGEMGTCLVSDAGRICVLSGSKYSPTKHSITSFVVDESKRGQGNGRKLLMKVIEKYKRDIGGQVSSEVSLHLMYSCGFRPYGEPNATLSSVKRQYEDNGYSLLLIYKQAT